MNSKDFYFISLILMTIHSGMSIFTDSKDLYYKQCLITRTILITVALILLSYSMYIAPSGQLDREISMYRDFYGF